MNREVDFVHIGPERHGVRRYGELLDRAVSDLTSTGRLAIGERDPRCFATPTSDQVCAATVHLQFSDYLLALPDFVSLVERLRRDQHRRRIVVTLHDCPGVGHDDDEVDSRRATTYAAVAGLADATVVSSHHERCALQRLGIATPLEAIPHLVEHRRVPVGRSEPANPTPLRVGALGFVYPGKGHRQLIDACARTEHDVEVLVLGGASPGHEDLVEDLVEHAARLGVGATVTGWLEEADLDRWLVEIEVPVVAHPSPSASGSLATWLSSGRRPLVAANGYTSELEDLAPGATCRFDATAGPAALAAAIDAACDDPPMTHRSGPPRQLAPSCIGGAHLALYRGLR
ncbi:MAG: hypothetical protein ACR2MB_08960 [Acidimicrobiales bacterium]